jgi:hypothetical protein
MRVVNVVYEAMPKPAEPGGRDCPFIKPGTEISCRRCHEVDAAASFDVTDTQSMVI